MEIPHLNTHHGTDQSGDRPVSRLFQLSNDEAVLDDDSISKTGITVNSSPVCIPPPQAVKLGQRLSEVLCVLPSTIRLLHPPPPAPYPPFPGRPIYNRVLVQDL